MRPVIDVSIHHRVVLVAPSVASMSLGSLFLGFEVLPKPHSTEEAKTCYEHRSSHTLMEQRLGRKRIDRVQSAKRSDDRRNGADELEITLVRSVCTV
jgi:hypothetical protein